MHTSPSNYFSLQTCYVQFADRFPIYNAFRHIISWFYLLFEQTFPLSNKIPRYACIPPPFHSSFPPSIHPLWQSNIQEFKNFVLCMFKLWFALLYALLLPITSFSFNIDYTTLTLSFCPEIWT